MCLVKCNCIIVHRQPHTYIHTYIHTHATIKGAMRINYAGRCIVEGDGGRSLPLSVWPDVLRRAYEPRWCFLAVDDSLKTNVAWLSYVLRNGPALTA